MATGQSSIEASETEENTVLNPFPSYCIAQIPSGAGSITLNKSIPLWSVSSTGFKSAIWY